MEVNATPDIVSKLRSGANAGNTEDQYRLGKYLYENNIDIKEGLTWLRRAAIDGHHVLGCRTLGTILLAEHNKLDKWLVKKYCNTVINVADPESQCIAGQLLLRDGGDDASKSKGLHLLELSANSGFGLAHRLLGRCYRLGMHVERDDRRAAVCFACGVARNDGISMHELGRMYYQHIGVVRDDDKAYKLFTKARSFGVTDAEVDLAVCMLHGHGCRRDVSAALDMLDRCVNRGDMRGVYEMAKLYYDGEFVDRDLERSFRMFENSASKCPDSYAYLGRMLMKGDGVQRDVDRGIQYLSQAANDDNLIAKILYGEFLMSTPKTRSKGLVMLRSALTDIDDLDDVECKAIVSWHYLSGAGIPQDIRQGLWLLRQSFASGNITGIFNMAKCKFQGIGMPRDEHGAWVLMTKLANEFDHTRAHHYLGVMYQTGRGTDLNPEEAYRHLVIASRELTESRLAVGLCHLFGRGAEMNLDLAKSWFSKCEDTHSIERANRLLTRMSQPSAIIEYDECPVCLEVILDRCILPCRHSLCNGCAVALFAMQLKGTSGQMTCPLCRAVVPHVCSYVA